MTFIDPSAFFNNIQRLNDEETMPETPKVSPVSHYSNVLFGSHTVASTEESVSYKLLTQLSHLSSQLM